MYFVSDKNLNDIVILHPRIPKNFMTEKEFEDSVTPRVCASPSIDQCLIALSQNLKNKTLYVYHTNDQNFIQPNINQVPDSNITNEVWYTNDTKFIFYKKIKVIKAKDEYVYSYGTNQASLYSWVWEEFKN